MRNILLLTLLLPLPLLAGEDEDPGRAAIAERDADGDGRLSRDEFGGGERLFDLLDRNGDGFLAAEELPQRRARRDRPRRGPEGPGPQAGPGGPGGPGGPDRAGRMADGILKRLDTDGDGKLSAAELPQDGRLDLTKADGNGDGFIDHAELKHALAGRRGGGPGGPPNPEQIGRMVDGVLKRLDKDGDGKLSAAELPEGGRLDLSKADGNGDGLIDREELARVVGARAGRGGRENLLEDVQRMDANQDGRIDRAEWKGPEQLFARLDADGDGSVSKKELKKFSKQMEGWRGRNGEALFRRADQDGDGKISADEWPLRPEFFERFDANGDGFITADEVTPRGPRDRRRPDVKTGRDSAHFLDKHDKNRDGQVTKQEFPHERRFQEIDADGDGVLSQAEIEEACDRETTTSGYGFFERFDLDGDGKVTREEFTGPARVFEAKDTNHDGVIDKSDG